MVLIIQEQAAEDLSLAIPEFSPQIIAGFH
jgi:hypothetical protein